jgi:hypothetical protein
MVNCENSRRQPPRRAPVRNKLRKAAEPRGARANCPFNSRKEQCLNGKRKRAETEGVSAWIDPDGYRRFIAGKTRAFEDKVDEELGASATSKQSWPAAGCESTPEANDCLQELL